MDDIRSFWSHLSLRHLGLVLGAAGIVVSAYGIWTQPVAASTSATNAFVEQPLDAVAPTDANLPDEIQPLDEEQPTQQNEQLAQAEAATPAATEVPLIAVYVVGAVAEPGVYELPLDARVSDAVEQAGGLSADADSLQVNLAQHLSDGQQIYVPRRGEQVAPAVAASNTGSAAAAGAAATDGLLDLNSASASDLEALPRIGAALAKRIVAYREEHGRIGSVEELRTIKGISAGVFEEIAPLVTVR